MTDFKLDIITPERVFYSGLAQSLTVESGGGRLSVLAGHAPMVAAIDIGQIELNINGERRIAFCTAGFMEVGPGGAVLFAQKCEWPEEIDERRAHEDEQMAVEMLRKQQSNIEHRESRIMLLRALTRLKVKNTWYKEDQ